MQVVNLDPYALRVSPTRDRAGREGVLVVVKGTFTWEGGQVQLAAQQHEVRELDEFAGDPGASGLMLASEMGWPRPMVDVLLAGGMRLARPNTQADVLLAIGKTVRKRARVMGDRVWSRAFDRQIQLDRPQAFTEMPFAWERTFGGAKADDPTKVEFRNPVGCGFGRPDPAWLGRSAPNFESPDEPFRPGKTGQPLGFGPVAPHWQPRAALAGTYDERWQQTRCPLVPEDFNDRFLNVAPADQQLPAYPAGEDVALVNFTPAGEERFTLPPFEPALTYLDAGQIVTRRARVDAIEVWPQRRTFTICARHLHIPTRDLLDVRRVFVGRLTDGMNRSLLAGKRYCGRKASW